MKVLIISADNEISKEVSMCLELRYENTRVIRAEKAMEGITQAKNGMPDLIIADMPLSDLTNIEVITKIREVSDVGIIFLSRDQSEIERAELLESGADDYILKPLECIEFLARVNALLRRTRAIGFSQQHVLTLSNGLSVDTETREVHSDGKTSRLTHTEYNLLMELVNNDGDILTNEKMLDKVWGGTHLVNYDSIKRCVYKLRSKIELDLKHPKVIQNKRGIGYRIA